MAASEKQRAEKIITVPSRPTINCQQVQDLSTSHDANSPPDLNTNTDSNTDSNTDTNTDANLNINTNTNTYTKTDN